MNVADHAKRPVFTDGQKALAVVIAFLAVAVTPVFFAVMFISVDTLLRPSFGWLAWTVPVATEISFTILYLLELLLEWKDRPSALLRLAPYLFAVSSLALNILAAHGEPAAALGHAVVTCAFFVPALVIKAAVRRFLVTGEERQREVMHADACAHARDILRSSLGVLWRWRAPVLLRRQLRSGRLPAKVLEAVENGARYGGATVWEPAVEAWITSAVTLPERVAGALRAARAAAAPPVPEPSPGEDSGDASRAVPRARPGHAPRPALKLTAARSRGMSPDRLAEHVEAMLEANGGTVSVNKIKTDLRVGTDKAKAALEIARASRSRVVPIGERRQA